MDTNRWKRVQLERNECRYVYAECFSFIKSFIYADMCSVFLFSRVLQVNKILEVYRVHLILG